MSAYEKLARIFDDPKVVTKPVFLEHLIKFIVLPVTSGNPELHVAVEEVIDAINDGDPDRRLRARTKVREVKTRNEADGLAARAAAFASMAFGELERARAMAACACFEAAECKTTHKFEHGRALGETPDVSLARQTALSMISCIAIRASFNDHDLAEGF